MFTPFGPNPCSRLGSLISLLSRNTRIGAFLALSILGSSTSVWGQSEQSKASNDGPAALTTSEAASPNQTAATASTGSQKGLIHIVPFGRSSGIRNATAPAGAHLTYFGGPILSKIHVVAVFWGPNVNTDVTAGIGQFFTDITSSNYYDLLTEYSTVGVTGSGGVSSNQAIVRGTFDAQATITPTIPCATTCTITDAQVQTELTAQITAGHLPQPVTDAQGTIVTFYMIYFPPGVTIQADPADASCVQFCAYHSNTPSLIPYGVLPDFGPTSGCSVGCGTGTLFQNVTAVTSHEMSEAVTDAQVGSAATFAAPLAWYDHNPPAADLGEIADICTPQDVLVIAGGNTYSVQKEFSNLQNDCVSAPPVFQITGPASVSPGVATNVTLTVQSSVSGAALTGYTGTVHFTSSDPAAVLPADYTFVAGDSGSHQFPVTLGTTAPQTITVTDIHSSGFNGTVNIDVTAPDLTITKTHVGNFIAGQTGTYTITVSNIGNGPTFAAVTVTDSLPAGLTPASLSGTGWTCSVGTVSCTRADGLATASSYPAISLVVNVGGIAPASVTNTVTVSGGGDTNTANNTASNVTLITAAIFDLQNSLTASSGTFAQGQNNGSYVVVISNQGNVPSAGVVTVTNSLAAGYNAPAVAGTGWNCVQATLTCTRADSLAPSASFPALTVSFNVAPDAPTSAVASIALSGGGDTTPANNTSTFTAQITPAIAIGLGGPGTATVSAGTAASYNLALTLAPTAGTVTFACAGLPKGAACSFSPASLTASGTAVLSLSTTSRATAIPIGSRYPFTQPPMTIFLLLVVGTLATLLLLAKRTPQRRLAFVGSSLLVIAMMIGCGGGPTSSPGPTPTPAPTVTPTPAPTPTPTPNPNGTPAGAYVITVTASGTTSPATQTITLVVN